MDGVTTSYNLSLKPLNTHRSITLDTSDGKEMGLKFSVHSGGFRDIKGFEHGLDFANREH